MNLYEYFNTISNKNRFLYLVITLILIVYFSHISIRLNIFVALILAFIVIKIMQDKKINDKKEIGEILDLKAKHITPKPKFDENKYPELIDFLFNIQEFYYYNPIAFTKMVNALNSFFTLYEDHQIGLKECDYNYDLLKKFGSDSLNSLNSIIYNLENSKIFEKKLYNATQKLQTMLAKYINHAYKICNDDKDKYGLTVMSKLYSPFKGYNEFNPSFHHSQKEKIINNESDHSYVFYHY